VGNHEHPGHQGRTRKVLPQIDGRQERPRKEKQAPREKGGSGREAEPAPEREDSQTTQENVDERIDVVGVPGRQHEGKVGPWIEDLGAWIREQGLPEADEGTPEGWGRLAEATSEGREKVPPEELDVALEEDVPPQDHAGEGHE